MLQGQAFGLVWGLSSSFPLALPNESTLAISHIGLLFLGASFVSNSICQRNNIKKKRDFILKKDDILGVAKQILPSVNLALSKIKAPFSGESSMTLKVAPFFLLGVEYGHIITLWRLCALAFFINFTIPKLYSCYASQINQKVDCLKWWVLETWGACSHKRIVAASAFTTFWNMSSIKTRIFTAFISLVILRYYRQHIEQLLENGEEEVQQEQHQALVVVVPEVVAEADLDEK